jgi:DNA-binding MarR family transcriptional regulator
MVALDNSAYGVYTHSMKGGTLETRAKLPMLPCSCANLRRAARAVTRLYNQELQSEDIEITQFTLLMTLKHVGEISQGELGEILALDSTSLTRMLKLLKEHGWVQSREGDDRRVRLFRMTKAGQEKFQQSLPRWKHAQEQLRTALGEKTMAQLSGLLAQVTQVAV